MTKKAPFHLGDIVHVATATYGDVQGVIRDIFMDGNDGPFAYVETNVCPLPYRAHLDLLRLSDKACALPPDGDPWTCSECGRVYYDATSCDSDDCPSRG